MTSSEELDPVTAKAAVLALRSFYEAERCVHRVLHQGVSPDPEAAKEEVKQIFIYARGMQVVAKCQALNLSASDPRPSVLLVEALGGSDAAETVQIDLADTDPFSLARRLAAACRTAASCTPRRSMAKAR